MDDKIFWQLIQDHKALRILFAFSDKEHSATEIQKMTGISESTLFKKINWLLANNFIKVTKSKRFNGIGIETKRFYKVSKNATILLIFNMQEGLKLRWNIQ